MSDNTSWQPPVETPPSAPVPPIGGPYGAMTPPPAAGPAWTPPPKPGLIPLHPLTLGSILGASFQVLRRNPKPTFGFALLLVGGVTLIGGLGIGLVFFFAFDRVASATAEDAATIEAGSTALAIITTVLLAVASVVASAVVQGVVSLEVARGTVGEKLTLRGLLAQARGRIGALIGWAGLVTAGALVGGILGGLVIVLAVAVASLIGTAIGVVLTVLLVLALVAGFVAVTAWLATKLSFVPSAIMLERLSLRAAIARSWTLVRGHFWRAFGIQLLVLVIVQTVASIVTAPVSLLASFGGVLINPNSDSSTGITVMVVALIVSSVVSMVIGAVAVVVQSATAALLYIDLRMRKEGLDLTLRAFVENRQAGRTVPDPYAAASAATGSTASTATFL